jgi:hypothetical protein
MKKECEQVCFECKEYGAQMSSFVRTFNLLEQPSSAMSRSPVASPYSEPKEVVQAFQLEAERKRAMGIAYSRRDITR